MIIPKVHEVIFDLLRKTQNDQVNWFPADDLGLPSTHEDDYAVSLPDASLNIRYDPSDDELAFLILDSQGNLIHRTSLHPSDEEDYELLEALLEAARFKARGVRKTLERIESFLKTDEIIGVADLSQTLPNVKRVVGNDLGNGVRMGGLCQGVSLKLVSSDWARWYDNGWVKSGWLYMPPKSDLSHAVAFFKVHLNDKGDGWVHILAASNTVHKIWFETDAGSREEHEFKWGDSLDALKALWPFRWKR